MTGMLNAQDIIRRANQPADVPIDFYVEASLNRGSAVFRSPAQYEILKSKLLTLPPGEAVRTVLLVGSAAGDGVSTTAMNLAGAMARGSQRKVVLLDTNLASPGLYDFIQSEPVRGLTDIVYDNLEQVPFLKLGSDNLYALPAGRKRMNPIELFQSDKFDRLLSLVRNRFDYVFLDAPPVLGFPESLVLSARVDAVILVVRSGSTRLEVALKAKETLEDAGAKLLGVVINRRRYHIPDRIYRFLFKRT